MPWVPRGLREGILTTAYPRRPDGYGPAFHGCVAVVHPPGDGETAVSSAAAACPTRAITLGAGGAGRDPAVRLDRGRCILCGRCTALAPGTFRFDPGFETATIGHGALVVPPVPEEDETLAHVREELATRVRALRRSVHVRHVDAGSDGSEEWEIGALTNPIYDVHRLGIFFTASPKHADLLLVTGAGSAGMVDAVRETYDLMPAPKVVVAVGTDAASGGMFGESYATRGGVGTLVPVDVYVPGSPPSPFGILYGILLALHVRTGGTRRGPGRDGTERGR